MSLACPLAYGVLTDAILICPCPHYPHQLISGGSRIILNISQLLSGYRELMDK